MAGITEYCMPERADGLKTFSVVLDSCRVDSMCFFSGIRPLSAPLFFLRDSLLFVRSCALKLVFLFFSFMGRVQILHSL